MNTKKYKKNNRSTKKNKKLINKKILIIGNGTSILNFNNMSQIIDSFDIIVRFNDYKICDFENYVGSKTTFWIISDFVALDLLTKYKELLDNYYILIAIPYKTKEYFDSKILEIKKNLEKNNINTKNIKIIPKKYSQSIQYKYNFCNSWPSTGLISIFYFLSKYKNITIHGFDFFDNKEKIHYFNDNCVSNHDSLKEKQIVYSLINQKKIKFLLNNFEKNIIENNYKKFEPIIQKHTINNFDKINLVIVTLTKNPIRLDFWLDYHINKCNIKKIYLRIEDTPELELLVQKYPNIIESKFVNTNKTYLNDYTILQVKQKEFINETIEKIKKSTRYNDIYTHILHIDDDELLYFPNGLYKFYNEILDNQNYSTYKINNIEAVYTKKTNNIFNAPHFCICPREFTSYCNGKSIGNLKNDIKCYGPHKFTGEEYCLNSSNVIILHYESSCINKWIEKFKCYSINNHQDYLNKFIPFDFYNESIKCFIENLPNKHTIWEKYKLLKYRHPKNITKLNIKNTKNIQNKIILSTDPLIYIIDNFINDKEINHIINISKNNLEYSKVTKDAKFVVDFNRNNSIYWINHDNDNITQDFCNKISNVLKCPLTHAEKLQVFLYNKNERYNNHYDGWFDNSNNTSKLNFKNGGQRMITCICYFNDVDEGGCTEFTKLNIKVVPKKGRILIFHNTYKDTNKLHELSMHSGCEIIKGHKWGCNLWFREKEYIK